MMLCVVVYLVMTELALCAESGGIGGHDRKIIAKMRAIMSRLMSIMKTHMPSYVPRCLWIQVYTYGK